MQSLYDPSCFDVHNVREAMGIILTPEDSTTEQRWKTETPYLADLMAQHLDLGSKTRLLDYGCGIGRMAKELITRHGCSVIGVDTSMSMRALAPAYVLDERFLACAPSMIMPALQPVHAAIAVWSLQHIPDVDGAILAIFRQLAPYGRLFVVNNRTRVLPMPNRLWADDGKDVRELLGARFNEVGYGALAADCTTPQTARAAYWAVYQRRS